MANIQVRPNVLMVGNDYLLEVARENITGASLVHKFGYNTSVGTGGELVADLGGSPIFPTTACSALLSSASDGDTASGTGVAKVVVIGLDNNWDVLQETVSLDGGIAQFTSGSFLRIYRMYGDTLGTAALPGATNIGAITAIIGGSNIAQISADKGQTLMCWWASPKDTTAYITKTYASVLPAAGATIRAEMQLFVVPTGKARRVRAHWGIQSDGTTHTPLTWEGGNKIGEKTDVYLHGLPGLTDADMSGGFSVICCANGEQ
jgi:hypothetical protein